LAKVYLDRGQKENQTDGIVTVASLTFRPPGYECNRLVTTVMIFGMKRVLHVVGLFILVTVTSTHASDKCSRTANMQIYSSAFAHKETGDVLGYELAVRPLDDSTVDALFYVYEGVPNDEAIRLSGHISDTRLTIEGKWVEHLIEYPSKKEIVKTHFVKIDGMLDSASFRGELTIEGMVKRDSLRLKRVKRIWLCKM